MYGGILAVPKAFNLFAGIVPLTAQNIIRKGVCRPAKKALTRLLTAER